MMDEEYVNEAYEQQIFPWTLLLYSLVWGALRVRRPVTKALSTDEKALRCYERAAHTAQEALEEIHDLHTAYKEKGDIVFCSLCFQTWPCQTQKRAQEALAKMKGQLPR